MMPRFMGLKYWKENEYYCITQNDQNLLENSIKTGGGGCISFHVNNKANGIINSQISHIVEKETDDMQQQND